MMKHIGAIAVVILLLFGCAAKEPTAVVNEILIPKPKEGYAVVVVMRDSIRPSGTAAKIHVDGVEQFALVNKRYGYAQIKEGTHLLQLDWPALTLNDWEKSVTLKSGKVYFYKVYRITAPFVFVTSLQSVSEKDAVSTMPLCCSLVKSLQDTVSEPYESNISIIEPSSISETKACLKKIKINMTPEEVVGLVGKPDKVSEWATGKKWIPFSFSTDNSRIKWVYNGAGYIHFSRHEYTDKVRVIEIVLDPDIK